MQKSVDLTCGGFVEALSSKAPVPGGGGAAALAGALGCALGNMVGSLTVGKPKYAAVEEEMLSLNARSRQLQERLLDLVARDAEAFEPLAAAYGMPTETEEQRSHKRQVMAVCLTECCQVPLDIMEACGQAIELCGEYAAKGSRMALSDAGCGAAIAKGALQAASLNVFINTRSMEDRDGARVFEDRAQQLLDLYAAQADDILKAVTDELRS